MNDPMCRLCALALVVRTYELVDDESQPVRACPACGLSEKEMRDRGLERYPLVAIRNSLNRLRPNVNRIW
jgi:hypothetical protein